MRRAPSIRIGFTYPEDRLSVSRRRYLWRAVRLGLFAMRASVPPRVPRLLRHSGASVLMLQHALGTSAAVARAHALGAPVLAWTVDDPTDFQRRDRLVAAVAVDRDPPDLAAEHEAGLVVAAEVDAAVEA